MKLPKIICILLILIAAFLFEVPAARAAYSWSTSTLPVAGNVGMHTSIAIDSGGAGYIVFYDDSHHSLRLIYRAEMPLASSAGLPITLDDSGDVGLYASIASNASGMAFVSYYDQTHGTLKLARYDAATNHTRTWTLDSSGNVGLYSYLKIDQSNNIDISYYDATNHSLKYISMPPSEPSPFPITVDSSGDVGQYDSLAINSSSQPEISYYDATHHSLKFATFNGTQWLIATVDSSADVGRHSSITVDSSGETAISYYDSTNHTLKWGRVKVTFPWLTETVAATGDIGGYTAIRSYTAGHYDLICYDFAHHSLVHASHDSPWSIETVDSGGDVGQYGSLVIGSSHTLYVAYYDATLGHLKLAVGQPSSPAATFPGYSIAAIVSLSVALLRYALSRRFRIRP